MKFNHRTEPFAKNGASLSPELLILLASPYGLELEPALYRIPTLKWGMIPGAAPGGGMEDFAPAHFPV